MEKLQYKCYHVTQGHASDCVATVWIDFALLYVCNNEASVYVFAVVDNLDKQ